MVGSSVGSVVGRKIGAFGGPVAEQIGEIGAGILGGMVGSACFVAGTQVVVGVNPDGSYVTKNIVDIQVGDYVLSRSQTDPNGPLELKQVTAVYVHQVSQEQVLTITDAEGRTETITCTSDHPFWVEGQGWTAAMDLAAGTELTSPDGSTVVVMSNVMRVLAQPINVYNFQVDGDHTYFVDDGGEPVWVHNSCSAAQFAANKTQGTTAEAAAETWLRSLVNKGVIQSFQTQVRVVTSQGVRVIDFLVLKGGQNIALEIKSGNALRTAAQRRKDIAMAVSGAKGNGFALGPLSTIVLYF
jgi:hypothetical protein